MAKIGFIGLGIMGSHMARNLIKGGHSLFVNGKYPVPDDLAGQTTVLADSTAIAQAADIVIAMVPDTPDVANVLFADDGVAKGLSAGKLVIDMSSISPLDTQQFAKQINALGCDYLDAPVSGGEVGARDATLTIMVGGPQRAFDTAKPLFDLMGKNISLIGDNGAGQTCKVANQIIVALNIEAVAEALLFAARSGADPERVRRALMGGFASSRILEVHGERMTKRTFNPGFRIELHQKDLNLALDGARKLGLSLPHTASAQQLFSACFANGGKAWDHSAMIRALELMANFEIADAPDARAKAA
ncbi:2-hydroxy-3-oxopropionate reductase [Paraburkholderia caballeronis]|uniref:2-hydroxy-3-oxopropionate reductase n=1 Tax=Paraburkholderia caballeronis TaxID=416943 RepID=A0A1H7JT18_9BURK|nr:2-hydroxy-3-oxopropionate reductase [Paraburkholderia caballeronis]PXW27303.1 2-hydroxy-3-oxopropionate reductase [Paraburkholderia caballeronis]PXX02777.1 2-hydroxy-3-oxopropionate reductase [Paraburkholderia caballeronis]RAK03502.1 2-hydroxy-3-oxopropionate reductase [Paraburkholderia caballeronis]SEC37086.1 2-hydroxy-3-oxopropionate reductase [Paraburkholderia caballeronis]SEK77170.1 2-hydroxy-3-oxopropionate reductase [Paraburkholderia caballeronis]